MNEGQRRRAVTAYNNGLNLNKGKEYTQLDEILENQQQKKEVKPKKQINPAEAQAIYKCLKQSKDLITQQSYQDCAYTLTKLPIFQYVYTVKGLSFITEFLKSGQLMEINENNHVLFDKDGNYLQRFFILIKGSVAFDGTTRKSKKIQDKIKQSPKLVGMGYGNQQISPKLAPQSPEFSYSLNPYNIHNQQEGSQTNRVNTLDQLEEEFDFDDSKSAVFRLDSLSDTDFDGDDAASNSSYGSFSKKSSSPPHSYNQDYFLSNNSDGNKLQQKSQKTSNFSKQNQRRPSSYAQLLKEGQNTSQSYNNYNINISNQNLSDEQDDLIKAEQLMNPNYNESNYMIQVNRPDSSTPQHNDSCQQDGYQQSSNSRKSSSRIIEIQIPQEEGNSSQKQLSVKSKQISSQRMISMPTENKIRSSSQVSRRRESVMSMSSQKQSRNLNHSDGSRQIQESNKSISYKGTNLLSVQHKDQIQSMRRQSNLMSSNKQSHNNSVHSSLNFQEQFTQRSQKSLIKTSNNLVSKKNLKKKKVIVVERFKTVNGVCAFGHKFKLGKHVISKIVTASEKCVLMSFSMKDFEELIYGMDESNGEIKLIRNLINKQFLFKTCSFRQISNLTFMSRRLVHSRDETIYLQNEKSKGIYFILSGEVKILIDTKEEQNNSMHSQIKTEEGSNNNSPALKPHNKLQPNLKLIDLKQSKLLSTEDDQEGKTHELFIHKNKNKLNSAQQKFTEKHRKEVGILGEGSFFGLEDLVLGSERSSTIQINSREAEILFIPLDHSDIFIYIDDEAKQDIYNQAIQSIDQRRKRAVSNISSLSQGLQFNQNNTNSSNNINNQSKNIFFQNNQIQNNNNKSPSHNVVGDDKATEQQNKNKSQSPNRVTPSPSPPPQNVQNRSISPPTQRVQTANTQPSNITSQKKVIQLPARFSKAAKLDDLLIKYPNQSSKVTPTKQPEVMVNNMFSVFDSNPTDLNKSLYIQNEQEIESNLLETRDQNKTNTSFKLGQSQMQTQNLETEEKQIPRDVSPSKIEPLEISDLVKSREIRQKRTESNTREASPRKKKLIEQPAESNTQNQKVNDIIQYYNLKKLEDAKTLKRRSFSCFIDGESEKFLTSEQQQTTEEKRQATTLDPKDIQKEDIIWKKDIIMSNTEYSPLNTKNYSQLSGSANQINNKLHSSIAHSKQKNPNQILFPHKKQTVEELQAPVPTAQFQNNLIHSNLSAKYVDPVLVKQKVDNIFYYPNKKTFQKENQMIKPQELSQSAKNSTKVNERLLSSSQGSRLQYKQPYTRAGTLNKSQLLSQENSLNNTQIIQINVKNSKQNSKTYIKDDQLQQANNKLLHPPSIKLTKERSNKRYSSTENKPNSKNPSQNASFSNLDDESITVGLKQSLLSDTKQMRSGISTAQPGKRIPMNQKEINRMSAPNERSFRIQTKNKTGNFQETNSPSFRNKSDNLKSRLQLNNSPQRQISPNAKNNQERAQSTNASTRNKIFSRNKQRQQDNFQNNKISVSQTVAMLNLSDIRINKSRNSPRLNDSMLDSKYQTDQQRNRRKMNQTALSCLSMKQSDNFNSFTPQMSTSMSRRPASKVSKRLDQSQANYPLDLDDKVLSELKIKQEIENMVVNPTFKLSNNFHFYKSHVQEEEGVFDIDDNMEQEIDVKKNLLNHIQTHSNKANTNKQTSSSEFKKSYVQKYIYPEDAFAREADQKIKIQQHKQEEEKNQNPYLFNTKFEENAYSSFMIFDDYKKRKLKYFHKNKNLYSGTSKMIKPEDQTPLRAFHVQNSAAVKNNKRKLKNSRKSQIQPTQLFSDLPQNLNDTEQQDQYYQQQQQDQQQNQNMENTNSNTQNIINDNAEYQFYMQDYNELSQINNQFSKTFNENDPYFSQFKNKSEIKQRQKDILHQFQTQKKDIKQNRPYTSQSSTPQIPQI